MSMIRSVGSVAITSMSPPVPAGTMAAFATTVPVGAFRVDEPGCGLPAVHADKNPNAPDGTTVMFNAYACAFAGTLQALCWIGKSRATVAASDGAPNAPEPERVSAMRHGVMA